MKTASTKNYVTAVILSAVFGTLGVHHFYLGRIGMGIIDFSLTALAITLILLHYPQWGFIIIAIDLVHSLYVTYLLLTGQYPDGEGGIVCYPGQVLK